MNNTKLINGKTAERLSDDLLENVSGGLVGAALNTACLGASMGLIACIIANIAYLSKAQGAMAAQDSFTCEQYMQKARNCGMATAGLLVVRSTLGVACAFYNGMHRE